MEQMHYTWVRITHWPDCARAARGIKTVKLRRRPNISLIRRASWVVDIWLWAIIDGLRYHASSQI